MTFPTTIKSGPYTIEGVSVGGVYTALGIPELGIQLDCGITLRGFVSYDYLFLSHVHADHISGLPGLLGLRDLMSKGTLQIYVPDPNMEAVYDFLQKATVLNKIPRNYKLTSVAVGDYLNIYRDIFVKPFPTVHPVTSLGYQFFRRVRKLKDEYVGMKPDEIAKIKLSGNNVSETKDFPILTYATDTTSTVWGMYPEMWSSRVIIHECTFVNDRRTPEGAKEHGHTHIQELMAQVLQPDKDLVLMHFSQAVEPRLTKKIVMDSFAGKPVQAFIGDEEQWYG